MCHSVLEDEEEEEEEEKDDEDATAKRQPADSVSWLWSFLILKTILVELSCSRFFPQGE